MRLENGASALDHDNRKKIIEDIGSKLESEE